MNDGLYFIIELYVPVFFHLLLGNLLFGIKLSFWAPTVLSQTCNHAASVSNKHILLMLYIFYDNNMKTKTKNKLAVNRKFVDIHYERILEYWLKDDLLEFKMMKLETKYFFIAPWIRHKNISIEIVEMYIGVCCFFYHVGTQLLEFVPLSFYICVHDKLYFQWYLHQFR